MGTWAPDLPTSGTGRSVADAKIRGSLITIRDGVNAFLDSSNNLDGTKLASGSVGTSGLANGAVGNTQLASGAALANLGSGAEELG